MTILAPQGTARTEKCKSSGGVPLEEDLNRPEDQGYEIYAILPMETEGLAFAIVARKSAERARRDAIARANRRARQRIRSLPRPGPGRP